MPPGLNTVRSTKPRGVARAWLISHHELRSLPLYLYPTLFLYPIPNSPRRLDRELLAPKSPSRKNILHNMPVHIRKPEATALEPISQSFVINP